MNLGTWIVTAFGGIVASAALRERARDRRNLLERLRARGLIGEILCAGHDLAGVPLALGMTGYTGVLLSCTANPMWVKNPWLGPLFVCSAFSTAAAAMKLAMTFRNESRGQDVLENVETFARIGEAITLAGYIKHAGDGAKPLTHGSMKGHLAITIGSLIAGEVFQRVPVPKPLKRVTRVASALATLAGGFALRWAIVQGGREAANDPRLARRATNQKSNPRIDTNQHE
jgi:formate-dependent nitrite reductase membrane component NrfD